MPYRYIAAAIAILGFIAMTYAKGRIDGAVGPEAELSALRLAAAQNVTLAHEKARQAEAIAAAQITRQQERTHEQLTDIDRRHRADLDRLRTSARAGSADVPGATAVCQGAGAEPGLAGRDAEDVARWHLDYGRDAAVMRTALDACEAYAQTVQGMSRE